MTPTLICQSCLTEYAVPPRSTFAHAEDWPPCVCGGDEFRLDSTEAKDLPNLGDDVRGVKPLAKPIPRVLEKAEKSKAKIKQRRDMYQTVNRRDEFKCRACGTHVDPHGVEMMTRAHHHHVLHRSLGGKDTTQNLVLLCPRCHHAHHQCVLDISGDADELLTFTGTTHKRSGRWTA